MKWQNIEYAYTVCMCKILKDLHRTVQCYIEIVQ